MFSPDAALHERLRRVADRDGDPRKLSVAPRERLLFLHIPKTAGTSLRTYLHGQYHSSQILPAQDWPELLRAGVKAADYALFAGHFRYNFARIVPSGTRTLTIMRDPVAHYLSTLRHARRDPGFDPRQRNMAARPIADIIRDPDIKAHPGHVQASWLAACADPAEVAAHLAAYPDGDPAEVEPHSSPDAVLARAKAHLELVDFVGVVEDLPVTIDEMGTRMRFHPWQTLPVMNAAGDDEALFAELRAEDILVIRRLTALDADLYAHVRDLSRRRRMRRTVIDLGASGVYQLPALPFQIDIAGPMPGSGWHIVETKAAITWRWTNAAGATTLELPGGLPPDVICGIAYRRWGNADQAASALRVVVDGTAQPHTLHTGSGPGRGMMTFRLSDPGRRPRDPCEIVLTTGGSNGAAADHRMLGLPVSGIAFAVEPAPLGPASAETAALRLSRRQR